MCPIGYEQTPTMPTDAYTPKENLYESSPWIIIGEISKMNPVFHVKPWNLIYTDIDCAFPRFFNIRKTELGV